MYASGRGRMSASPRGSVHLASVGVAQGAPQRVASGSDGEQTRRETGRAQPPQSQGSPARGEGCSTEKRARRRAHDPGCTGKGCRAAGIQPQRRGGFLMAAKSPASQVGVAPACRALGVSRATFYRRHRCAPGRQQPRLKIAHVGRIESERDDRDFARPQTAAEGIGVNDRPCDAPFVASGKDACTARASQIRAPGRTSHPEYLPTGRVETPVQAQSRCRSGPRGPPPAPAPASCGGSVSSPPRGVTYGVIRSVLWTRRAGCRRSSCC